MALLLLKRWVCPTIGIAESREFSCTTEPPSSGSANFVTGYLQKKQDSIRMCPKLLRGPNTRLMHPWTRQNLLPGLLRPQWLLVGSFGYAWGDKENLGVQVCRFPSNPCMKALCRRQSNAGTSLCIINQWPGCLVLLKTCMYISGWLTCRTNWTNSTKCGISSIQKENMTSNFTFQIDFCSHFFILITIVLLQWSNICIIWLKWFNVLLF